MLEIETDAHLVRRLLADQFPEWAGRPLTALPPAGTDHHLYRLGDDLVVRMPRIEWAIGQVETDRLYLPKLAPHLPVAVPAPVAVGAPGFAYPWSWSIVPWLPGSNPTPADISAEALAADLAGFVAAMARIETTDGPPKTGTDRGVPLLARDEITRSAIAELGNRVDARAMIAAWDAALAADPAARPTWIHGDLSDGNLLVSDGRLSAVIDFLALGVGDPAIELLPAWYSDSPSFRRAYREASACDDATWARGKGWVLSINLVAMPYYWDSDPAGVAADHAELIALLAED